MTFKNSAWAIDGAIMSSAQARQAAYSAAAHEGVVLADDLKVTQLSTPGVGVQIAPGVVTILNRYQSVINESYSASNPSVHIIPESQMPASNPSARSYILAVVIGDPEFAQTGHPWMLASDPPAGEETTFEYVRPTLIQVSAGATSIPGATYPYYALARIDIPANTTTITNSMITDLRRLANPRRQRDVSVSLASSWSNSSPAIMAQGGWTSWGAAQFQPQAIIPSWARFCTALVRVGGAYIPDVAAANIAGGIRLVLGSIVGPATYFDLPAGMSGNHRLDLEAAQRFGVASIAGTTVNLNIQAWQTAPGSPTANQRPRLQNASQIVVDLEFTEQ